METDVPARLDRLPFSRWHWLVALALGITWVLDGLEVTVVGAVAGVLERPDTLGLTSAQIGLAGTCYVGGAVIGALVFGRATDRLGRKRLFLVTLSLYLVSSLLTATSIGFASFAVFRFFTGAGIGGEYAAINSAIDELMPARVRGFVDLAINGSFWIGAALGAALSLVLLDPAILGPRLGWRAAFGLGALLGLSILLVRRHLPESPRWLLMHGYAEEADRVVSEIEKHAAGSAARFGIDEHAVRVGGEGQEAALAARDEPAATIEIEPRGTVPFGEIARVLVREYPRRSILGFTLMVSQAFFYNAIFFTFSLVLTKFYGVVPERVGLYIFPFAAGNFLGPLLLGRLFDSIGRRVMIAVTYALSAALLVGSGLAFVRGALDATTQTALWSIIFFIASAAASSAYLTVSEIFPVEMRAVAIAVFYSIGTGAGGLAAPALFGVLVASGSRRAVFDGYLIGAALMALAAGAAIWLGIDAERKSLEQIAAPLGARTAPNRRGPSSARD